VTLSVKLSAGLYQTTLALAMRYTLFQSLEYPYLAVLAVLILLCGSETEAIENQTVTSFDPSIIYGGTWKTNGSHGINHKNSKSGGAFANYTFQGSAIYYTGEISSGASPVEIIIDSVSHAILNISHQARAKGMKTSASDVEILFSAENLDSKTMHTFTLKDYEASGESDKFITLYRLTVTTGSSSSTSSDTHNQATETNTPKMYGMETSSGDAKSKKGTVIGASLGVLFGVAVVLSVGILIFRRRRRVTHKESILQSVTPFIVQSYWWRVAAGERLPKLVRPELKRADPPPRIVITQGQSNENTRVPQVEAAEIEVQIPTHDPPPEYIV